MVVYLSALHRLFFIFFIIIIIRPIISQIKYFVGQTKADSIIIMEKILGFLLKVYRNI